MPDNTCVMKNTYPWACLVLVFAASGGLAPAGENWPNWRGPNHNGAAAEDEKNLPTTWTATTNVLWRTPIPGASGSTPIVWGSRAFVSTTDGKNTLAMCISATDGKVLWQAVTGREQRVFRNNMAAPSPVTDGRRAYFLSGKGQLAAFDMDGGKLWSRTILAEGGMPSVKFGYSSSPLLHAGRLYVQVLQNRLGRRYRYSIGGKSKVSSYLLAIDPATGKDIWRQDRPTDAPDEGQESYATPIVRKAGDGEEIVVMGGDHVTGHDPADGRELWRWGSYNSQRLPLFRIVPSPVDCDGVVVVCAPKGDPVYAFRSERIVKGAKPPVAWSLRSYPSDVCTPLYYGKRVYVLDGDGKAMTCIDPKAGKVLWTASLGGSIFRASPTGADGRIYCIDTRGNVTVLAAGDKYKVISRSSMGESPCYATIVAVGGRLYVRTGKALYCISGTKAGGGK